MGEHLVSTPATPSTCPRCRAATLTGLAEGLIAHADTQPISHTDEAALQAAGHTTYALIAGELVHRDDTRTSPTEQLHAEHHCPPPQPPPFEAQSLF